MKHLSTLLVALFLPLPAAAQSWDDAMYKKIEQGIRMPQFTEHEFNITKYGASPKASAARNQKAINNAITACSKKGGGRVVVPAGVWNTGAIRLQSHVNLVVEEGATLKFAFDPKLYTLVKTSWEGVGCRNYSPCIYAYQAKDVGLTGNGTIDGNGIRDTWWPMCGKNAYGYVEGKTKEAQNLGSRARLLKYAENGVPWDDRKFGMGHELRPQLINFVECD